MSEQIKIREVSQLFGLSTRTLRYYEQIGLLPSIRGDDYAYRMYDPAALSRLRQIVILRNLRFPLKDIHRMLTEESTHAAIELFAKHLDSLNEEVTALSRLREMVERFLAELKQSGWSKLRERSLQEGVLDSLALFLEKDRKGSFTMQELENISKKTQRFGPVRIMKLPPMRMAAYRAPVGPAPEKEGWGHVNGLFKKCGLKNDPTVRIFGFDNPGAEGDHGYEFWVCVPEHITIPAPFSEIRFPGGLYAAHVTPMHSIFDTWMHLVGEMKEHPRYAIDDADLQKLDGKTHPLLEESLGEDILQFEDDAPEDMERQLDLMLPIKPRA